MSCDLCKNMPPITTCADCDREFLMIDVRYYRAMRAGKFIRKVKSLEKKRETKRRAVQAAAAKSDHRIR